MLVRRSMLVDIVFFLMDLIYEEPLRGIMVPHTQHAKTQLTHAITHVRPGKVNLNPKHHQS
jgi:hypothetical protein